LGPHQGLGQGERGEQREEERGTSIWRDFHSVSLVLACSHARCKHSSPALVGRPGQEGEPLAGMAHSPPSCWLTFPSSHSVILTVINKIYCKSPGTTFVILSGNPESQGPSSLQISGVPRPASEFCPKFCYSFRAPDGLYFPGVRYFKQGKHHTYGHVRCVYTVLAHPTCSACQALQLGPPQPRRACMRAWVCPPLNLLLATASPSSS
jgi:hypothetical protein